MRSIVSVTSFQNEKIGIFSHFPGRAVDVCSACDAVQEEDAECLHQKVNAYLFKLCFRFFQAVSLFICGSTDFYLRNAI